MRKTKPVQYTKNEDAEITCDRCKKIISISNESTPAIEEVCLRANICYGSKRDGERWVIDLCDDCADWLTTQVSIQIERDRTV